MVLVITAPAGRDEPGSCHEAEPRHHRPGADRRVDGVPDCIVSGSWDRLRAGRAATPRACELQRRFEVGGQRRRHVDLLAGERVGEAEPRRVQELARESEVPARRTRSRRRRAGRALRDGRGSGACGPSRAGPRAAMVAQQLDGLEPRHGVACGRRVQRMARAILAIAPDRRLDPAGSRSRRSTHQRQVAPLELPLPDHVLQPRVCLVRAGDDEQAGGVLVQPVHDSRPVVVVPSFGSELQEPMDEGAGAAPPAGWTTIPAGLSATSRCSSSQGLRDPSPRAPARARPGCRRSTLSPPPRRWLFGRRSPSTSAAPAAIRRSASARDEISGARPGHGRAARPPGASETRKRSGANAWARPVGRDERGEEEPTPTTMNESARLNAGQ